MCNLTALVTGLCLTGLMTHAGAATTQPVAPFIDAYKKVYAELGLGGDLDLSYVKNINNLLQHTDVARQRSAFDALGRQFRALDASSANPCQHVQLQQIAFELELNQQKLALLDQYLALGKEAHLSDKGLASTTMGKEWYAYLRKSWLTMDTTPEALMAMGQAELDRALARYRTLQARMGYAGRDQEFAAYLAGPDSRYSEGTTPQADYEARQATVYQNLHKLFLPSSVKPPQIRQSDRGPAFPADGYYDPDQTTFYFNKGKDGFKRRNIDWLLLHESTPGHHFQHYYALEGRGCPTDLPHQFYSAYAEGWGAYVEEFGSELGLFQTDADELGAVEWNMVRSIRVVLDVGINQLGWSESQAHAFWQSQLPMLPSLADREIQRVRNWPVQAITYKLGAVMLRQLRAAAQAREGASFDIRVFHDRVLKNGAVPLAMLADMVQRSEAPQAAVPTVK